MQIPAPETDRRGWISCQCESAIRFTRSLGGRSHSAIAKTRTFRRVSAPKSGPPGLGVRMRQIPDAQHQDDPGPRLTLTRRVAPCPKDRVNGFHPSVRCPRARRAGACALFCSRRPRALRARIPIRWSPAPMASIFAQSDLALAEEEVGGNMPQMAPDQKREYLITYLADIIMLAQAAEQQKFADRDDVKHRIEFERNKVLMEALLQNAGQGRVTDDAMHKVYDDAVKQMPQRAGSARASHPGADRRRGQGDRGRAEKGRGFRRRSPRRNRRIPAPPTAAISAISPRTRWCRNSPTSRSSSTRARFPIR